MIRALTTTADLPLQKAHGHERKSLRRSTKYLRMTMNLASTKTARIAIQRAANPQPEKEPQQSKFVDPRSQAKLAETLAPKSMPVAKKRVYKVKKTVLSSHGVGNLDD